MEHKNQKIHLLYVLEALQKKSDELHPLSTVDLVDYCYNLGCVINRRAIYSDIETLVNYGYEILLTYSPKKGYYLASRQFETVELKLLIDAIQSSNFISNKKSQLLISKISSLGNQYQSTQLTHSINYTKRKGENESIFYTIDAIQNALNDSKPIHFLYFDITVSKQKKYRHNAKRYELIPYAMVWENQRYYCIGYDSKHQDFAHYRIDKMDQVEIGNERQEKIPFNQEEYTSRVFNMYQGALENITLKVDNHLASVVFDQFGQEVMIIETNDKTFTVNFTMSLAPTLISWLFQFGNRIEVLSPPILIDEMKKTAQEVLSIYNK